MADYSINAIARKVSYTGSAGVGPYAFSFEVLDQTDVAVYKNTSLLNLTTDYTVTINANGTGSVTLVVAASSSDRIVILGARDIERTTDFVTAGDLRASSLNEQLDSLTIFDQQIDERVERSIKAPAYDPTGINMTLPGKAERAGQFLSFDDNGNPITTPLSDLLITTQRTTVDEFVGDGVETDFTLSVSPGSKSNTNVFVEGVYQRKDNYSVSGSTISFTTAPPLAADSNVPNIEVTSVQALSGLDDSDLVNYNEGTASASDRTVKQKLQEMVSVKDFGARGDGTTNDTAAINAAITATISTGQTLYFPAGDYIYNANNVDLSVSPAIGSGVYKHFRIKGENKQSRLLIDANGTIFEVDSFVLGNQFFVEDMTFNLVNPSTNSAATCFRVTYGNKFYGAHINVKNCDFNNWTYAAVFGVRLVHSRFQDCVILGASTGYNSSSGNLTTYDDAGLRIYGADGTLSAQEHNFSNFVTIENVWTQYSRYGIDSVSMVQSSISNCTFQNHYIGLTILRTDLAPGNASVTDTRRGSTLTGCQIGTNWFENIAKYNYTDVEINPSTGNDVNPSINGEIFGSVGNLYISNSKQRNATDTRLRGDTLETFKFADGTDSNIGTHVFLDARIANSSTLDGVVTQIRPDEGFFRQRIKPAAISFGANELGKFQLDAYEEDNWTPVYESDGTPIAVTYFAQDGKFTRIGRIVFIEFHLGSNSPTAGTGNLFIGGLPFTPNTFSLYNGLHVTEKSVWSTNGPDMARCTGAGDNFRLFYDNNTATGSITVANLGSGTNLKMCGFYFTDT